MSGIGEWLREKAGMSTEAEKRARGETGERKTKRDVQIEDAERKAVKGVNVGELGKKWEDTFEA